ncbi:MAG: DUF2283 domain-containing protein [Desulfurococcales archaeon]|nr:DUF2283 domain-containing protein [Desulfurococcales archaeon]
MAEDRFREYEEALSRVSELKIGDLRKLWIEYDKQNDILYFVFSDEEPDESIMIEDDIIVSLKGDRLVSISVYNFSKRVNL